MCLYEILLKELKLDPHELLQLLKLLYERCESGDIWFETLDAHFREDLDMLTLMSDIFFMSKE